MTTCSARHGVEEPKLQEFAGYTVEPDAPRNYFLIGRKDSERRDGGNGGVSLVARHYGSSEDGTISVLGRVIRFCGLLHGGRYMGAIQ